MSRHARAGFTLLETLAVVAITGFLVASIVGIYVSIMTNSERATETTGDLRAASAVLDRVARDLERAYVLVKDEAEDPLAHPWLFVAESHAGQLGADRVMFTTVSHSSHGRSDERASASGLATYAYWLEGEPELGYDLMRWVRPTLADDHRFPDEQSERAVVLAEGLAGFSLHFLDEQGSWSEEWDSTTLVDSGELPVAVEIRLALPPALDDAERELRQEFGESIEPTEYRRRVVLYQRPVSRRVALGLGGLGAGEDGEEGAEDEQDDLANLYDDPPCEGGSMTFGACFNRLGGFEAAVGHLPPKTQAAWQRNAGKCIRNDRGTNYPFAIERCR